MNISTLKKLRLLVPFAAVLLASCGGDDALDGASSSSSSSSSGSSSSSSSGGGSAETITIQENEAGFCSAGDADLEIQTEHSGYQGAGFVDTENEAGADIAWQVSAAETNMYSVTVRFANGGGAPRSGLLSSNGNDGAAVSVELPDTSSWDNWQETTVEIALSTGSNALVLTASGGEGLANIDSITVAGPGIATAQCEQGSSTSSSSSGSSSGSSSSSGVVLPPDGAEPDSAMVGFATVAADGLQTTTGGDGGEVVRVSNYADLAHYASLPEAYVIQVEGTITGNGSDKMMFVNSNTTIIGLGSDAVIREFGFDINGYYKQGACNEDEIGTFTPVSNVIIRNLTFNNAPDDGINAQCQSHHIWIDHNTFENIYDGAVDIKRGSDWATVSWNHTIGTDKTMLLGHDPSYEWLDSGNLHVTYHHNYFENTKQRHPRVRFGEAHVYNNYMEDKGMYGPSHFVGAGEGSHVFIESNYIYTQKDSLRLVEAKGSDQHVSYMDDNIHAVEGGKDNTVIDVNNGAGFDPSSYYSYSKDSASDLPSIVPAGAGAGKL